MSHSTYTYLSQKILLEYILLLTHWGSLKFLNFAIFNIADMAISISAVVLCVYLAISMLKKDEQKIETGVSQETNDVGEESHD